MTKEQMKILSHINGDIHPRFVNSAVNASPMIPVIHHFGSCTSSLDPIPSVQSDAHP